MQKLIVAVMLMCATILGCAPGAVVIDSLVKGSATATNNGNVIVARPTPTAEPSTAPVATATPTQALEPAVVTIRSVALPSRVGGGIHAQEPNIYAQEFSISNQTKRKVRLALTELGLVGTAPFELAVLTDVTVLVDRMVVAVALRTNGTKTIPFERATSGFDVPAETTVIGGLRYNTDFVDYRTNWPLLTSTTLALSITDKSFIIVGESATVKGSFPINGDLQTL